MPSRTQLARFTLVGALCTPLYLGLYVLLRHPAGPQAANAAALLLATVVNTAAIGRYTFGRGGTGWRLRPQAEGLVVFGVCLALTDGALAVVHVVEPHARGGTELAALVAASLGGTAVRLVLLRHWVFRWVFRVG